MKFRVLINFQELLMILGSKFGGKFKYENKSKRTFTSLKFSIKAIMKTLILTFKMPNKKISENLTCVLLKRERLY